MIVEELEEFYNTHERNTPILQVEIEQCGPRPFPTRQKDTVTILAAMFGHDVGTTSH